MAGDYERMCSMANLARAYRWTQSNSEAYYKSFFRDAYAAYAGNSPGNLARLRRQLVRNAFQPSHASKIFLPKASGLLRPYTLLTVNDQVVYQACANIVADKLKPNIKKRYLKSIFGHLYAGKSSPFFYMKWQNGYRAFSNKVTAYIEDGYRHVANFDLTAFYDSIDHHVLKTILERLEVDDDLIHFLMTCLRRWTSANWSQDSSAVYHGHGIPQGPLPSGLLSEVVLSYLDGKGERRPAKYLRYVDDIKLFAKSEAPLRQQLIDLDLATKDIGLFPQSSKINIRYVSDARSEIKSVSVPPEPALHPLPKQDRIQDRILEIARTTNNLAENKTRFKYLLGRAAPSHRLNRRLMQIIERQPALSAPINNYIRRYERLPRRLAEGVCAFLEQKEIYHAVHAEMLMATIDNMPSGSRRRCADYCRKRVGRGEIRKRGEPQASLKAALWAWMLRENRVTYAEIESLLRGERDAWVVKDVIQHLRPDYIGAPSYERLINIATTLDNPDANRVAAVRIVEENLTLSADYGDISLAAKPDLFAGGKIKPIGKSPSMVGQVLSSVLVHDFGQFDWPRLLGGRHAHAERIAFSIQRHYETSIDACIVAIDSLCDLIFECLLGIHHPTATYGHYGAMLTNPTVSASIPTVCSNFKALHDLRCESITAHPRAKRSAGDTRRLKHEDLRKVRPGLIAAIREIVLRH